MKKETIQNITFIATSLGILALALWTLPDEWSGSTLFAHIAFESIRASILIGNIQVTKQSTGWGKPTLVFVGSITLTILIGLQIASEFPVSNYIDYLSIPEFWGKQMGNIAVLIAEVTLMFQLGSDSDSYKVLDKKFWALVDACKKLSKHYGIDDEKYDTWEEIVSLIIIASQSERNELETVKNELRTVKNSLGIVKNELETVKNNLETVRTRLGKVKTTLEMNRILLQETKVSIDGYTPIICGNCDTINPTNSNRQERTICSGCGQEALKPIKTQIRKLKNG